MGALRRHLTAACCSIAIALVAVAPARAALFDDTEARQRIDATNQRLDQIRRQLEDRIAALESQIKNLGLVDLFNNVEQIRGDVAKLRGQIEVITFELGEAQKRQRDLYIDLDSRLRRLETANAAGPTAGAGPTAPSGASGAGPASPSGAGPGVPGGTSTTTAPPTSGSPGFGPPSTPGVSGAIPPAATRVPAADPAAEQRAYDAALDLFKSGNYSAAITGFGGFVRAYPRSALAPSAQYWIGNAQFALRDFRAAIASQRQLIANYPDSAKVPDAMLNIATSQFELGDIAPSRRTLEDLVARYPQSEAAGKARQRLSGR